MRKKYLILLIFLLPITSNAGIKLGIDVLAENGFEPIRDKRIALLTNFAGRNAQGRLSADILIENSGLYDFKAVLSPEHGFYTTVPAGKKVGDGKYKNYPVYSLYGDSRKPTSRIMSEIDVVVIDMQDIGVRSYTYLSTVYKTMVAAEAYGKKVLLLDRPNPIGGMPVDGGTVEPGKESFVSIIPVSYIHGCTFGELANMINNEGWLKNDAGETVRCNLEVIKMENWQRWMAWEDTGLHWFPTSPHVPTVAAVRGLASFGIFGELSICSIGIGTCTPFQLIGKPEFSHADISEKLHYYSFSAFDWSEITFMPLYGMYSGKPVNGYFFAFTSYTSSEPYTDGIKFMLALRQLYPDMFYSTTHKENSVNMFKKVTGTGKLYDSFVNFADDSTIIEIANEGKEKYLKIRKKYLLYY